MRNHFYNTGKLTKFIGKREFVITLIWFVITIGMTLGVSVAFDNLFETEEARVAMAETMRNPAMTVMVGPGYGIDNYHTGAMMSHEMLLFTGIAIAIMNIFLVARHTRKDEEEGRLEVIRSLPVGRLSSLSATMIVCVIVNTLLTIILGLGMFVLGIASMDLAGCMLYAIALGLIGIVFGAITAIFVQLSSSSKGAIGYSFMFLGVAYIIRGMGDVGNELLSLISPLGLPLRISPFVDNNLWPILVMKIIAFIAILIAFHFNSKRDLGAGLIPAKKGKAYASSSLLSPFGFARKLLRTSTIWWVIALFTLGATYGSVFGDIDTFLSSNDVFQQMFTNPAIGAPYTLAESFMATIIVIMAIMAAIPVIIAVLRIRKEETSGRLEHILSRNVSRTKMFGCFLMIAIITSFVVLAAAGVGLWVAAAAVMDEPISFTTVMASSLAHLPAIWVMIGLAMVLIAYLPRYTSIIWGYVGFSFVAVYLGELLKFPEFIIRLSPFGNVPKIPVTEFNMLTAILLVVISIILFIIGFIGYKRRDIAN